MQVKKTITWMKGIAVMFLGAAVLVSCSKNDNDGTQRVKEYTISPYQGSNISGKITFRELGTDSVDLTLTLQGVSQDGSYPVVIRQGASLENGPVKYDLGYVDGRVGSIDTKVALSFDELLQYDGSLDVYRNPNDTVTVLAQSELGVNESFKSYDMMSTNPLTPDSVNGVFRIYKRNDGAYLVIRLDEAAAAKGDSSHPARVYKSDGTRDFDLSDVSAHTGISATKVTNYKYDELIAYKGFIRVFLSDDALDITLSQGTINP